MPKIRELNLPDGKRLRGYEVEFKPVEESWSEYLLLPDGDKVRIKHTLLKLFRLVDDNDNPMFDQNGDPEVFVNGTVVVTSTKVG